MPDKLRTPSTTDHIYTDTPKPERVVTTSQTLGERRRLVLVAMEAILSSNIAVDVASTLELAGVAVKYPLSVSTLMPQVRAAGLLGAPVEVIKATDEVAQGKATFASPKAAREFEEATRHWPPHPDDLPRPEQETRPEVPQPAEPERSEARSSERFRDRMAERAERAERIKKAQNQAEVRAVAEELLSLIDELEQRVSELEARHEAE